MLDLLPQEEERQAVAHSRDPSVGVLLPEGNAGGGPAESRDRCGVLIGRAARPALDT